jgi:hypothetical protein
MPDAYDLEEVTRALGLKSKHAARKRVHAMRDVLEKRNAIVYLPDKGNALAVTPEGLELLQKAKDFGDLTIAEAAQRLRVELGDAAPPPDAHELRAFKVDVKTWQADTEEKIEELKERIEAMERKLPWWAKLARMLPRSR